MPETIILKTCTKSKEIKPLSELYISTRNKSGYRNQCKICYLQYGIKYRQTEKGKEYYSDYHQTERFKANCKQNGKKYRNHFPERTKANTAVNHAIRAGKMPRPDSLKCSCGEQAEEYHHADYSQKHWFDVTAFCRGCHKNLHLLSA